MTDPGCRAWREDLTDVALGRHGVSDLPALQAHLDGCHACRAELEGLASIAAVLADVDVDAELPSTPPDLGSRVSERVHAEQRSRRRRRWLAGAGAGAAAAAVILVVALTFARQSDDAQPTASDQVEVDLAVVLDGEGVTGSADFVAKGWGTEIFLVAEGLTAGDPYQAWLSPAEGERVSAGTFLGTEGGRLTITLASSLPLDDARWIWVTDRDDDTVLAARF